LSAVGLSSPPSWIKPYQVLSNGEKFRCDLARALLQGSGERIQGSAGKTNIEHPTSNAERRTEKAEWSEHQRLVVFDEFTSVVDRTVARIGSAAVSRAIRSGLLSPATSPPVTTPPNPQSPIPNPKFIAVSCHYDVLPWLEPDWVLDMGDP